MNMENKGCSLIPWEDPHDDTNVQKNDEDKEERITWMVGGGGKAYQKSLVTRLLRELLFEKGKKK